MPDRLEIRKFCRWCQPQVDIGPNVGQPINLADCSDWNQANTESGSEPSRS